MQNLKITCLSDSAFRLWVRGLCYCQTALTDGLIPRQALRDMGAKRRDVDALSTPQVPGRAPLWEPHDIGFKVHDYLSWNDCRDKVVERQKRAKDRKDKWESEHRTRRERVGNTVPNASENTIAAITQPNQTKPREEKSSREARAGHRRHAFCPQDGSEGFCVPEFLHGELATMLGSRGDGFDLLQWYVDTDLKRRNERPVVASPLDWWRGEMRATMQAKGWLRAKPRPGASFPSDPYAGWRCPHVPECGHPTKCQQLTDLEAFKRGA